MLTEKHLAVIRAALKYWDEEMTASGDEAFDGYLADQDLLLGVTSEDTKAIRHIFNQIELGHVLVDVESGRLLTKELVMASSGHEFSFQSDLARLAAVLLLTKRTA